MRLYLWLGAGVARQGARGRAISTSRPTPLAAACVVPTLVKSEGFYAAFGVKKATDVSPPGGVTSGRKDRETGGRTGSLELGYGREILMSKINAASARLSNDPAEHSYIVTWVRSSSRASTPSANPAHDAIILDLGA